MNQKMKGTSNTLRLFAWDEIQMHWSMVNRVNCWSPSKGSVKRVTG